MKMTQRRMARPSLGGLMATRQGALALALVCAVSAAGILVFALGRYRSSVRVGTKQATVLVATGQIPKGTSGGAIAAHKLYKAMPIVSTQLAAGAISDASLLPGKVAAADILAGQQLTLADFTTVTGVTGLLTPDQRAVSVSIDEAHGATDVLQAGDHVDAYAAFTAKGSGDPFVVLLVPNALVIKPATGATPSGRGASAGGSALSGGSLVMSVSAAEAPQVIYAAQDGQLYLTLRPTNGTTSPRPLTTLASVAKASVATTKPNGKHP
jgi:Flp pilus assembly protein CpaB